MLMRVAACVIFVIGSARLVAADSAPNIVMFVADDLGATDLGCFGSSFYESPNLDKLAARGMRFTSAYSTCPVCSPTRSSIMTGRYPARTGVTDFIGDKNQPEVWARNTKLLPAPYANRLALEERTIAESLRDAGYATFFAGKWHLGARGFLPTEQGFDINKGGRNAGSPRSYFSPYGNPKLKDGPRGEELSMRLATEAINFIEKNSDKPFFVYMPFYAVHIPLQASPELVAKYKAKAANLKLTGPESGRDRYFDVRLVQNHPVYAGMIEAMDAAVGAVLAQLESTGLAENTIVVFTSDNGGLATAEGRPTSNRPLRAGKGHLYEGGIRVPTIVRWPGVTEPGSDCATPIVSSDFFPTFLEAAGRQAEPEHHVDGVSVAPLLRGAPIASRRLYWHYPHYGNQGGRPGGAIRDGKWKFIESYEDNSIELYNLESDPGETKNVANDDPAVAERLRVSLAQWRRQIGARMPKVNPNYRDE